MSLQKRRREEPDGTSKQQKKSKLLPAPVSSDNDDDDIWGSLQHMDTSQLTAIVNEPRSTPSTSKTTTPSNKKRVLTTRKKRAVDVSLVSSSANNDTSDHAHMLANQWISAVKLNELAKTQGLIFKKGKFSAIEESLLFTAIESYRQRNELTKDDITAIVYPRKGEKTDNKEFWFAITSALEGRPVIAVYHYVRRAMHEQGRQGVWTTDEDTKLRNAVTTWGRKWEQVSGIVGRTGSDCRDRWRNHLATKNIKKKGPWTDEEVKQLKEIVKSLTVDQGKDVESVPWSVVSTKMGNTRSRQQCRVKWYDSLAPAAKLKGVRWGNIDSYILVHKIDSLNVLDDTEIVWKDLLDEDWNAWSPTILQKKYFSLKNKIKDYQNLTHNEIMDILREQWVELPENTLMHGGKSSKRKITSAETIEDSDDDEPVAKKQDHPSVLTKDAAVSSEEEDSETSDSE